MVKATWLADWHSFILVHLHSTSTMIRLLTDGGIPLVAMHKYAPISVRLMRVRFSCSPSYTFTAIRNGPNVVFLMYY